MSDKPLSTAINLENLAHNMNASGVSVNQAAIGLARLAGRDVMLTPDNEVCDIVDAVDGIPVSDTEYAWVVRPQYIIHSDLRDVWNG